MDIKPNKKNISLSVFFPTYNEEDNITETVRQTDEVLRQITPHYEIIVVNDGSSDMTRVIADNLKYRNPRVKVVHHEQNQGYGAALVSGLRAAKYDYIFFTDADLQFDISEISKLLEHVPEHQVVIGYRAKRRDPFMRLVNAKGWNILNRLFFGLKVKDIDCAFKLFDRRVIDDLKIVSRGAMISAEILIRLQRQGIKFKEVPVTHLPRTQGSPTGAKPAVIIRAFRELIMLYRGDLGTVNSKQAGKFGVVGLINTGIDIVAYILLTRFMLFFAAYLVLAKIISFGLGTISSFILNRRWTFEVRGQVKWGEVLRFYAVVGSAMAINASVMYFLVRIIGMYDLLAVILTTIFTFVWSFFLAKFWVFRPAPKPRYALGRNSSTTSTAN
jgi:glycosyltransferase involved in cell wall biosynthesis